MNGFPPPTGARHARSHLAIFRATSPPVLDPDDLALVGARRRASNRLGFAVQLCALRHPGGVLDPSESPPAPMVAFVANQIGIDSALFADDAQRDQTRREHAVELQRYLGLRRFGLAEWRTCLRVGTDAAWATDRGEPIVRAMLAHLQADGVLLPAVAVLERIGLAARARARKKTFEAITSGLSDSERGTLTGLLSVDPELRQSRFAWLQDYSESPAPSNIVALLDRLEYARGLGIDAARAGRIHAARLARLVDEGAILSVPHIAELEPARRTAILVVQAVSLETQMSDATLAMFEKYMGTLFSRARNRNERRFQATRRDVARALILFRRTIAALRHAKEAGEDGVAVVEREIGMKQLDGVLPVIGAVADVADQDLLVTAAERYSVLRRFSPRFLAMFDFRSNTPNDPVLAAVEFLRAMDRDGTRVLPKRPPSSFLPPQWRKLIFASGAADRRLYETAVLATLRERLRGSNIWVPGSRDYRAFVMDDIILASFIASAKDPSAYAWGDEAFSLAEPYGIVLRRDDAPFKALVDKATSDLYLSPEGKAIYSKWFQAPIPPKGLNLNTPMSKGMVHAYAYPSDNADPASYVE